MVFRKCESSHLHSIVIVHLQKKLPKVDAFVLFGLSAVSGLFGATPSIIWQTPGKTIPMRSACATKKSSETHNNRSGFAVRPEIETSIACDLLALIYRVESPRRTTFRFIRLSPSLDDLRTMEHTQQQRNH